MLSGLCIVENSESNERKKSEVKPEYTKQERTKKKRRNKISSKRPDPAKATTWEYFSARYLRLGFLSNKERRFFERKSFPKTSINQLRFNKKQNGGELRKIIFVRSPQSIEEGGKEGIAKFIELKNRAECVATETGMLLPSDDTLMSRMLRASIKAMSMFSAQIQKESQAKSYGTSSSLMPFISSSVVHDCFRERDKWE
ncbi:hypothetical protein M9H77_02095 [Catharanthus roseus]|uniref:Uncharacterized protein n=1 Tax=Catharanthus roseus TaxID=4058 RepID=A0ACC0C7U7_CATRO|nr:hypothetical protein M9H77_02095 [Catharanthus roseus]